LAIKAFSYNTNLVTNAIATEIAKAEMYIHEKLLISNFSSFNIFRNKNDKIISIYNLELMESKILNSNLTVSKNISHYGILWNDRLISDVIRKI
jgi:hypothetical protein